MSEPDFDWAVTNLGNASVLIQVGDAVVLTDPFFGRNRGIDRQLDPADVPSSPLSSGPLGRDHGR